MPSATTTRRPATAQAPASPEQLGTVIVVIEGLPEGSPAATVCCSAFRTLAKVRIEIILQVLTYNMKQMIQIFGVGPLMAAIRA